MNPLGPGPMVVAREVGQTRSWYDVTHLGMPIDGATQEVLVATLSLMGPLGGSQIVSLIMGTVEWTTQLCEAAVVACSAQTAVLAQRTPALTLKFYFFTWWDEPGLCVFMYAPKPDTSSVE